MKYLIAIVLMLFSIASQAQTEFHSQWCVNVPELTLTEDPFSVHANDSTVTFVSHTKNKTVKVLNADVFMHYDGTTSFIYQLDNDAKTRMVITYINSITTLHIHFHSRKEGESMCFDTKAKAIIYVEAKREY